MIYSVLRQTVIKAGSCRTITLLLKQRKSKTASEQIRSFERKHLFLTFNTLTLVNLNDKAQTANGNN